MDGAQRGEFSRVSGLAEKWGVLTRTLGFRGEWRLAPQMGFEILTQWLTEKFQLDGEKGSWPQSRLISAKYRTNDFIPPEA